MTTQATKLDESVIAAEVDVYLRSLGINTKTSFSINGYNLKISQIVSHYTQAVAPWLTSKQQLQQLLKTEINDKYVGDGILSFIEFTIQTMGVPANSYGIYRISAGNKSYVGQSQNETSLYSSGRYGRSIAGRWTVEFLETVLGRDVTVQGSEVPAKISDDLSNKFRVKETHGADAVNFEILELLPAKKLVRSDGKFFSPEIIKSYLDYKESYFMGVYDSFDIVRGMNEYENNLKEKAWEMGSKNAGKLLNIVNFRRVKALKLPYAPSRSLQRDILLTYRQLIDHKRMTPDEIKAMFNDLLYLEEKDPNLKPTPESQQAEMEDASYDISKNWAKNNQEFATVVSALSDQDISDPKKDASFKRIKDVAYDPSNHVWNSDLLNAILSNMTRQNQDLFYKSYPETKPDNSVDIDQSR